jgi:hypothetical protein
MTKGFELSEIPNLFMHQIDCERLNIDSEDLRLCIFGFLFAISEGRSVRQPARDLSRVAFIFSLCFSL